MIEAAEELGKRTGVSKACQVLGVPRSSLYWTRQPKRRPVSRCTPNGIRINEPGPSASRSCFGYSSTPST